MINLIPPAARRSVVREYWLRAISVWLLLFGTGCLIVASLLLPTYVLIRLQVGELEQTAVAASEKVATYDVSASALVAANKQAQLLMGTSTTPFSTYLTQLEQFAGAGVVLRDIQFVRSKTGVGSITVAGTAATRQVLANFRDALEAEPAFSKVNLPISNLIKDRDLLFVIDITLATSTPTS